MKRKNAGHELDFIAEQYKEIKNIVIYGIGEQGNELRSILEQIQFEKYYTISYVDKNYKTMSYVNSPEWLLRMENKNVLIVITIAKEEVRRRLIAILFQNGFSKNNICDLNEFYSLILPVLTVYYTNKLYIDSVQISIGDKCNLNCADCTNFIPYMKNRKNRSLNSLIEDIDLLFDRIDYVRHMPVLGGETFLHSQLFEFVSYLLQKYGNRIGQIWIYTNGTLPNRIESRFVNLLNVYESKIHFFVSNYTHQNPKLKKAFVEFVDILDRGKISYVYIDNFIWTDTGISNLKKKEHTDLCGFVSLCSQPCRDYEDGKIYYCAIAKYAGKAFEISDQKNEIDINVASKKEIVEFLLGYIDSGYLDVCAYCNGYDEFTNTQTVEAGIQMEKVRK